MDSFDFKAQDTILQTGRAIDSRIAIIALNDQSFLEIGQWLWKRDVHAQLVQILTEANVGVLGFDITFPLPSDNSQDDERFIKAVSNSNNVVIARYGVFDRFANKGLIESIELSPF